MKSAKASIKNNLKRIIASILVTLMIFVQVPWSAIAVNADEIEQSEELIVNLNEKGNETNKENVNNEDDLKLSSTKNNSTKTTNNLKINEVKENELASNKEDNENTTETNAQTNAQTNAVTNAQTVIENVAENKVNKVNKVDEENNVNNEIKLANQTETQDPNTTTDPNQQTKAKSTTSLKSAAKAPAQTAAQLNEENAFKVNLRWAGTSNTTYNWNANEQEKRVIKLTFYYQNEVTPKAYAPGELVVTIPGIGKLNRNSIKKASDIAADEYGAQELKRDWSYQYDARTDTYTFYNNKEIEQGASFNGSFEMIYEFTARESVNDYIQTLEATLTDGEQTATSQQLAIQYTSKRDTFYINKTARAITSIDGLNRYVEAGKTARDYAWVRYTFRYNTQQLNARGLKSRYLIDTLPEGCIIASNTNVIKNQDGTVSYKVSESSVPESSVREYSIIVGYPEEYAGQTVDNTAYIYGKYYEENEDTLLAQSTVEVMLEKVTEVNTIGIVPSKYMSPDYIYNDTLDNDINFSATLYSTATVSSLNANEYTIAITDDLLEINSQDTEDATQTKPYTLKDDEYTFKTITVPGRNSFTNSNGFTISDGNYTVKLYALYAEDVNTRALSEYTLIDEREWGATSFTKSLEGNVVAIRAEVSGLTESINSFYISTTGTINIAESDYQEPTYIINYDFTDLLDSNGDSLLPALTQANYSQERIYNRDNEIYGKGVRRSNDTIRIIERTPTPGTYSATADIAPFTVDENVENFQTTLTHKTNINNRNANEITNIEVHGVVAQNDLETLIETIKLQYTGLKFKTPVSNDTDMNDYLMQRATITKEGNEISISFNFEDNPITATNFSLGYTVDAKLKYEDYYENSNPNYLVRTYSYTPNGDLQPQSTATHNSKTMATANDNESILLALASHQELIKMVKTMYTGDFVQEDAVSPINTEYTYRLKLRNGYNTLVNTEFIDILEHAELTEVDGEYPYTSSEWYGTFRSVDVTYMESKGLTTKAYYANTLTPSDEDWTLMESYESGIWSTTSPVKAIKVAIEGEIQENTIAYIDVNMLAPNDESLIDKKAYNTYTINCKAVDLYSGLYSTYMDNLPSNQVDVRLTKKEYNVTITKTDATTGAKLAGVQFGIYDSLGNKIRTNITSVLGDTIVKHLKEGTYTIKEEITPAGYSAIDDYTLIIENGNYTVKRGSNIIAQGEATVENNIPVITFNIENQRAKGSIIVHKIDEYKNSSQEEIVLENVEFDLYNQDGILIDEQTTNEEGNATFENLDWGKNYTVAEKTALQGYELATDDTTYLSRLDIDENTHEIVKTITIENKRKTGSVELTKQDEIDGTKLEGAKYGVFAEEDIYGKDGNVLYAKDDLIKEAVTNEEGKVTFTDLIWGDYYLKETETVYGYDLSEEKHLFTINAQSVDTLVEKTENEKRSKANLQLVKIDDKGAMLQGVEFTLYNADDDSEVLNEQDEPITATTNEIGQLNIEGLEWGNYYLKETKALDGYETLNTKFSFTVDRETFKNNNTTVTQVLNEDTSETTSIIRNTKKLGKVILTKYAAEADGTETDTILPDAEYELYQSNGTLIDTYTTNEDGQIEVDNLDWNSYYFLEKNAPAGYSTSDKKISFVINSKNASFVQQLSAYDKPESGELTINKTIKANELYQAHGNATFVFKIVGKDDEENEKLTMYRTLTFSSEDVASADVNGNITKTIKISDVESYKYVITEEENYRYELDEIIPVTNAEVDEQNGIINLIGVNNKGEITFANDKASNSLLTDSEVITNSMQSEFYVIGMEATAKHESYSIGVPLTPQDFTYKLYYSGGQEVEVELTEGVTFNGQTSYAGSEVGDQIVTVGYSVNGKTFESDVATKWVMPSDYFTYETNYDGTINITGVNSNYASPEVLFIPSEWDGKRVNQVGGTESSIRNKLSNIENVKSVEIAKGVTSIGAGAFYGCTRLTSVTIPEGVTSIGERAFNGCTRLTSVTIPEGVKVIKSYTFFSCYSLTNIEIPEGVRQIADNAFCECESLTSITIPEGVTSIGANAFSNCTSLTSVTIPEGVTSIEMYTFNGCTSLTSVTIPEGVTSIRHNAFSNCRSLTTIEIPESVTSIGYSVFYDCSNLTSVEIPEGVTSIESMAFSGCSSLTSIEIPEGVTSIGGSAFSGCSSLTNIDIPESVTGIENNAFSGCSSLTSVIIPEGVTSIGSNAFSSCANLTEINVDNDNPNYSSIEGVLFNKDKTILMKCPEKKSGSVSIPEGVTSIESVAFNGCSSLTSITIPEGVTSIGGSAFKGCSGLTSIEIPEGVTSIGRSAFESCSGLTSITIPEGVTSIEALTFNECSSLTSLTIPEGLTSIGNSAFRDCASLRTVYYRGTAEQFRTITIGNANNDKFKYATKVYEYTGP